MNKKWISIIGALIVILLVVFCLQNRGVNNLFSQKKLVNENPGMPYIKKNGVSIDKYGVKGDGITDDTENFQRAIDDAVKNNKILIVPAKVYVVSPLKYRDPTSSDWWCLNIPSNAQIYFEKGAIVKLVADAPTWTRVIVIDGVSNIKFYGRLEVNGNAATVTNGNEHMAGIFIYDAQNIFIESAYAHDCYGDNLFIGGLEDNYADDVRILYFKGVTAGRKNLVIHYVDRLHIGTAALDNSRGGVSNKWKGENSLDLEPDDFFGNRSFYQRIDHLSTYGKGNDFTVGTEKKMAEKWILDIGTFHVVLMPGATEGLQSYACTVKVDKLVVKSLASNNDIGMSISYAAIWEINKAYFVDGNNYAISAREEGGEKPNLTINQLIISRPKGKGISLWGADATIDYLEANSVNETVLKVFATNVQQVTIEKFMTRNSSKTQIIDISDYGFLPKVSINELSVSDDRQAKAKQIIYLDTQKAVDGFEAKQIHNYDKLNEVTVGPGITKY